MSPCHVTLRELQDSMMKTYGDRDLKRGPERTLLWMCSEVGEVVDAYIKGDLDSLGAELGDLLAWMLSFCNLLKINLEEVFMNRYGSGCPKCSKPVCECAYI